METRSTLKGKEAGREWIDDQIKKEGRKKSKTLGKGGKE